ncbi:EGF-like domain-containing protein [Heterostelium album PN500]|uniref:EGF-like domain-containing protein n=1 Tax=Heterostelium pallidum (strain ATCC 26659 / Pp 5 / PN500) TaxID=670386 RepID=D3B361_HETP5|nr:EGF-like domain-containing protein [Heterostelium album PN500]EFA83759.1 EGF-like domain-containing protein [Heterostelium album PN500]|eukprot:XP_020435876.1 EGF-like domain-containing protein [Heterostelium album PN500]
MELKISELEVVFTTQYSLLYRFRAAYKDGIRSIKLFGTPQGLITVANLVSGDSFDGYYEYQFNTILGNNLNPNIISFSLNYQSYTNFYKTLASGALYDDKLDYVPYIKNFYQFSPMNFTYFAFEKNSIDMGAGGDVLNTLWFSLNDNDPTLNPMLDTGLFYNLDSYQDKFLFYGEYVSEKDMYKIDFIVYQNTLPGNFSYTLLSPTSKFSSNHISSLIGSNATFKIINSNGDFIRPILKELVSNLGNNINVQTGNTMTIGWNLRITDYPNGFLNGTIEIVSEKDLEPIFIMFNETSRIRGDKYDGVYQVNFTIDGDTCRSQTFVISKLQLFDLYPFVKMDSFYNSFSSAFDIVGTQYEKDMNITINCQVKLIIFILQTDIPDSNPPKLETLSFTKSIDVGSSNRIFEATFSISDVGSGISLRHNPYIYILTNDAIWFKVPSQRLNYTSTLAFYNATAELPWGFGQTKLVVSIYGIVDNYLNMNGYSTQNLKDAGYEYTIIRTQTFTDPIIESCSQITKKGGSIFLYGHNFGVENTPYSLSVDYRNGSNWVVVNPTKKYASLIQVDISPFTSDYIQVKIQVNSVQSNILIIYPMIRTLAPPNPTTTPNPTETPKPTVTPSPNPKLCPGEPVCNNQGECLSNGCKCNAPWYGPSCSSKVSPTPIPPPAENPSTEFNVTNPSNPDQLITAKISVVSLLELNSEFNTINRFVFNKWNLSSVVSNDDKTSYSYYSYLNGRNTIVNTTIDFFKKESNITFAGGVINIVPFTIKFTVDIDHFDFVDKLSLMQIVMEATVTTSDSGACSSKFIGEESNDNVQWVKMNINDNSLYGRFLDRALVDDTIVTSKNVIIENDSSDSYNSVTSKIGIIIPYYENNAIIDPDFSSLVDSNYDGPSKTCKKKGLSTGAIVAIAIYFTFK